MKMGKIRKIADAVLYEGYLLYPYRRSALKNRQRWTFGVVYPRAYSEANGHFDPWSMHTECLVTGPDSLTFDVYLRFLHLLRRSTTRPVAVHLQGQAADVGTSCSLRGELAYKAWDESWDEGIEREISVLKLTLSELLRQPRRVELAFSAGKLSEHPVKPAEPVTEREQRALVGNLTIAAERVPALQHTDLYRLSVHIENTTPVGDETREQRDAVLLQSFVSTHTILHTHQGSFLSLLDPPDGLQEAARTCQNSKTWPVLVGEQGDQDTLLSSPIILYDYPQIAPESPGAFFDGTEIDEMLALRVLTLSDEEKAELRRGDERGRELLARTEALSPEQLMRLHGTMRELRSSAETEAQWKPEELERAWETAMPAYPGSDYPPPSMVTIAGGEARVGSRVRLHPKARADAFDLLLNEKVGRVEAIQQDFENRLYLVVTLDDDPGREQWDERVLPGHRFFFFPTEVELVEKQR